MRADAHGTHWPTHKRKARQRRRYPPRTHDTTPPAMSYGQAAADLVERGLASPMILGHPLLNPQTTTGTPVSVDIEKKD